MEQKDQNGNIVYFGQTRPEHEILKIILIEFKKYKTIGLCQVVFNLLNRAAITKIEGKKILEFLEENRPKKKPEYFPYWFSITNGKEERMKFLENLIIKTE